MKMLMCGLVLSFGAFATDVRAEIELTVDGEKLPLSTLMDNCKSLSGQPEAQVACYTALSALLEAQSSDGASNGPDVGQTFENLRAVAAFDNGETGLTISGSGCKIEITYFANYFHISRRNVSSIDLHHASFDAGKLQLDQVVEAAGGPLPVSRGTMQAGVTATSLGGPALESATLNFSPKSARASIGDYAGEVASQIAPLEAETFDFVLVHPHRAQARADIWSAFEAYVTACQG